MYRKVPILCTAMLSSPQLWKHVFSLLSNPARHTPKQIPIHFASPGEIQGALILLQAISRVCIQTNKISSLATRQ